MANYAARSNGVLVGAHTILEMDESRSSGNKIFLKNVGEEAGVQQFTGEIKLKFDHYIWNWSPSVFTKNKKILEFSKFFKANKIALTGNKKITNKQT